MQHVELLVIQDDDVNGMAVCLKPRISYVITNSLVNEIHNLQNKIAENYYSAPWEGIYYIFWYLNDGKIPWKGLDFNFIYHCLKTNNESKFEDYIDNIFLFLFTNYTGFNFPLVNCSIVNRNTFGISRDFFYLNRINFIKQLQHKNKKIDFEMPSNLCFKQLDIMTMEKKMTFPKNIYAANKFYKINSFNASVMKNLLIKNGFTPFSQDERNNIKYIFDKVKDETIKKIYALAYKNIIILSRCADIQSIEHRSYLIGG